MNCVIIEDEPNAAAHLEYMLGRCNRDVKVMARLETVKSAFLWLKQNNPDLIFLDVQLGDDLSFSIFQNLQVTTPVIFTTSYEEYAVKAFDLNSIAYLLKPVLEDELRSALDKYDQLYAQRPSYEVLGKLVQPFQKRFLVQAGSLIQSIPAEEIAFFFVQNRHLFITTRSGEQFLFDSTLEAIENRLDPEQFFRINRQYIVSIHAIDKMFNYSRGRVKLITDPAPKEDMIVSIDRAAEFKSWLNK